MVGDQIGSHATFDSDLYGGRFAGVFGILKLGFSGLSVVFSLVLAGFLGFVASGFSFSSRISNFNKTRLC